MIKRFTIVFSNNIIIHILVHLSETFINHKPPSKNIKTWQIEKENNLTLEILLGM
jgi:hypothetical protein